MTLREYHALLDACEGWRQVAPLLPEVVEFTALTGLRRGEVFNLRWASFEFDRQVIRVVSHRRGCTVNGQAWRPKHGKWREVPLEPAALALLERLLEQAPSDPDDLVFPNKGGAPYAPYARLDRAPDASGKGYFPDAVAAAGLSGKGHLPQSPPPICRRLPPRRPINFRGVSLPRTFQYRAYRQDLRPLLRGGAHQAGEVTGVGTTGEAHALNTKGCTPGMEAGLPDHVWKLEDRLTGKRLAMRQLVWLHCSLQY